LISWSVLISTSHNAKLRLAADVQVSTFNSLNLNVNFGKLLIPKSVLPRVQTDPETHGV